MFGDVVANLIASDERLPASEAETLARELRMLAARTGGIGERSPYPEGSYP